jgi:PAS domain S-box-containing protein
MMEQRSTLEQEFHRQKTSEESLRHQTALQQALIDTIPYPIFYKGPDCRFLGFNLAYEKTFNVKREQLIGKQVLDLDYLPEADRVAYQAEDERVIKDVDEIQREMLIPFADGELHQTLYCVSGFRLDDGQPGGLVGMFIDFTNYTKRD